MTLTLSLTPQSNSHPLLVDFAGVDGLPLAKTLAGTAVERLAPFQSLEVTVLDQSCSLLRLCEGNFRLSFHSAAEIKPIVASITRSASLLDRVWVKTHPWLSAFTIPDAGGLALLPDIAVPKPPHRLKNLPLHRAIPARIDKLSVLIWRHFIIEQPVFELHFATAQQETIQKMCYERALSFNHNSPNRSSRTG